MTAEITHHLAAAGGMADVDCILEVQVVGDGLQIIGIVIHVVAAPGLSRAAMSAPINCDDPIALGKEEHHLRVPIVRAKRPAVAEHHGLSAAPVFVVDMDVLTILFPNSYIWHDV